MDINELFNSENKYTPEWFAQMYNVVTSNPIEARFQLGARDFRDNILPASQNEDYLRGYYSEKATHLTTPKS